MANWCDNKVSFQGDEARISEALELFAEIERVQKETGRFYLPEFITAGGADMRDINIEDKNVFFETRWVPNTATVYQIAERFGLDYVHQYEEIMNYVHGEATCKNGMFNDIHLGENDYLAYDFDPTTGTFVFEGKNYSDNLEIINLQLEKKIADYNHQINTFDSHRDPKRAQDEHLGNQPDQVRRNIGR